MNFQIICCILLICAAYQINAAPPKSMADVFDGFANQKLDIANELTKKINENTITEEDVKNALADVRDIGDQKIKIAATLEKQLSGKTATKTKSDTLKLVEEAIRALQKILDSLKN